MIKLTYRPTAGRAATAAPRRSSARASCTTRAASASSPTDAVHATMKIDMSGAAAVLAAMSALARLGCKTAVTGYLMCTDNMPSGTAMKLGDVLTIRGGKTVEVMNTDAEGRLVMADALVLAAEEAADAIVDIATLTGGGSARSARDRRRHRQPPGARRSDRGRGGGDRRAGLAAPARPALPQGARLGGRRHQERRRRERRAITAALFLEEFVGDGPVGAHRHRRHGQADPPSRGATKGAPASAPDCSSSSPSTSAPRGLIADDGATDRRCRERRGRGGASRAHRWPARWHRAAGQQGPAPGDDVPVPDHLRDRPVGVLSFSTSASPKTIAVPARSVDPDYYEDPAQPIVTGAGSRSRATGTSRSQQTIPIQSLLTIEGIRFIFTSFVPNFADFGVVAVTFVALMGAGVAEAAGLMGALIRHLVAVSPRGMLAFILIFVGVLSSVASDAGYLILIPLAAAAFASVGRHPLAGHGRLLRGRRARSSASTSSSAVDAHAHRDHERGHRPDPGEPPITIVANFFFAVVSLDRAGHRRQRSSPSGSSSRASAQSDTRPAMHVERGRRHEAARRRGAAG